MCHNHVFPLSSNSEYIVMSRIEQRRIVAVNCRVVIVHLDVHTFTRHIVPFRMNMPSYQLSSALALAQVRGI